VVVAMKIQSAKTLRAILGQPEPVSSKSGPGAELAKSLAWVEKVKPDTAACDCENLAAEMDLDGKAKCRERRDSYYLPALMANKAKIVDAMRLDGGVTGVIGLAVDLVPDVLVRAWIGRKFDAACDAAKIKREPEWQYVKKIDKGTSLPPMPFVGRPRLTLIFHCWPKTGGWEKHIEKLKAIEHRFGRKLMGISVGAAGCATEAEVRETFGDSWEYFVFKNNHLVGEEPTMRWALSEIDSGPDDVAFYCHSKGTKSATMVSEAVDWWTATMYETVIHNIDSVLRRLADGAVFAGSLRYAGKTFPTHNSWHFSGTFYAFRSSVVAELARNVRSQYYGTEAYPSDCVPFAQSACMFSEINYPYLYEAGNQPRDELDQWRMSKSAIEEFEQHVSLIDNPAVLLTGAKVWENSVNPDRTHHAPHGQWTRTDIEDGDGVDLVADLEELDTVTAERFDAIFSHSTLEHVKRPWVAVKSMANALKTGGVLYIHSHQTFPLHGYPHDHFRFSTDAMRTMCEDAGLTVIKTNYDSPTAIVPDPAIPVWDPTAPAWLNVNVCAMKLEAVA
jgi:hypothetical protein